MGVQSKRDQLYLVTFDICNRDECLSGIDSDVHSKKQAIYAAGFHIIKWKHVLCDECFERYRKRRWSKTFEWEGIGKLSIRTSYTEAVMHFEPDISPEVLTTGMM